MLGRGPDVLDGVTRRERTIFQQNVEPSLDSLTGIGETEAESEESLPRNPLKRLPTHLLATLFSHTGRQGPSAMTDFHIRCFDGQRVARRSEFHQHSRSLFQTLTLFVDPAAKKGRLFVS